MIQDAHSIADQVQRLLAERDLEQVITTDRHGGVKHGVVLDRWDHHVQMSRVLTVDHVGPQPGHPDDAGFVVDVDYVLTSTLTRPVQRSPVIDRALDEMRPNFAHLARSPRIVCLGHGNLGLALREWVFVVDRATEPPAIHGDAFGPGGLPVAVVPRASADDDATGAAPGPTRTVIDPR